MKIPRRKFIRSTAAAFGAFTIIPRHVLGGAGFVPPSEKVNIGIIGAGGRGRNNVRGLFTEKEAQIIAVADPVDHHDLEAFYYKGLGGRKPVIAEIEDNYQKQSPKYRCAGYEDFRDMLEKEKDIDAVLCATPDHLHAYISVTAMRAGKHVYCEKPLTHNIWEARKVAQVAKETGVATQLGNQGHSNEGIRQTCEWIWDGAIGPVREVHAWVGANRWNPSLEGRPTDTPAIPSGVNWDLWLGPREYRPYHPTYSPVTWRDYWSFGSGSLGDFGCHDMDAAVWALDLKDPTSIEGRAAGNTNEEITPFGEIIYYQFPARGKKPPVKLTWYDGGLKPPTPEELPKGSSLPGRGLLFVGDSGKMLCDGAGGSCRLLPYEKTREYKKPDKTIARSLGHHRDWLRACKGGPAASSHFEYGARLTEIVLLGVATMRLGKTIHWDADNATALRLPAAEGIIKEQYRKGWEI
ncbi:MAG TPA: Gfo/Idh/MocA family oxidoreductase [Verrucomicrobiales bacterium]|nr:Gfo/Idh/MocA family oxidoreductase [Verrucomicrobiales bacterium]